MGGIYVIENRENGKLYVGSASSFRSRFQVHRSSLNRGVHHSHKLQHDWSVLGSSCFSFRPIIMCAKRDFVLYERRAIIAFQSHRTGYNVQPKPRGSITRSPESRERNRLAAIGRVMSEESRKRMSAAKIGSISPRRGCKLSDETKQKIRAKLLGRKLSPQHIANAVNAMRGKPRKTRSDKGLKRKVI